MSAPLYGIGAEALAKLWIEREKALPVGKRDTVHQMRRELQEACGLVADSSSNKTHEAGSAKRNLISLIAELSMLENSHAYAAERLFMASHGKLGRLTQKGIQDRQGLVDSYAPRMNDIRSQIESIRNAEALAIESARSNRTAGVCEKHQWRTALDECPYCESPSFAKLAGAEEWMICPIERCEELGTHTHYLVVNTEFDTLNYTGRIIAECSQEKDARTIANTLNARLIASAPMLAEQVRTLRKGLLEALTMLERHDAGTADAIRSECKPALAATAPQEGGKL